MPWVAARLGYDPDRVAELPPGQQRALGLAALAAFPAVAGLAVSAAWGAFLASDSLAVAWPVGAAAGLYLFNLLRVAVAGGGVGPQQPYGTITTFFPRTVPLVMLALLGVFFAQPLLLAALASEQDAEIEQQRQRLGRLHELAMLEPISRDTALAEAELEKAKGRPDDVARAERRLAELKERRSRLQLEEIAPFRRHLDSSHFLLRRVELSWERPLRASLFSLAMVALMVLPWLASATIARGAARAYEARRWKANRALIDAAYKRARQEEARALVAYATYEGPRLELHEDAPYNTRPRQGAGRYEVRHG